jgi:hypothetical protein
MTNYTSEKAIRIIGVTNPIEYKVGDILTIEEIGTHWTGYTAPYSYSFDEYNDEGFNYLFEVSNANVRVVNYLDETEQQGFECHSECEVHFPANAKFEIIATDTEDWSEDHDSYEESYNERCDMGYETITLKILNNEEKAEEFDLNKMITEIERRLECE